MQAVIFTGIQVSGKSTFYKQKFFKTHLRINLDMLKTRHREAILLQACLAVQQKFVIDNTNITVELRANYIKMAQDAGFGVIGYYFQSKIQECIKGNPARRGKERISIQGLKAMYNKLQLPTFAEGFDELYNVRVDDQRDFMIKEWNP